MNTTNKPGPHAPETQRVLDAALAESAGITPKEVQTQGVAAVAVGSALTRDVVERAERYTDTFCSLTDNTCGEISTRLHAAVLLHELRSIRRYCGCLEEQLDEFGLKAAQRAAGLDEPNTGSQTQPPNTNQL